MANELAAIAQMPNGATITVIIICAQQMMVCSMPIGRPIRKAFRMVSSFGRKQPLFFAKLNSGERYHKYHNITAATNDSATTVPKAAPPTPKPAPNIGTSYPPTLKQRVGNIKKKLSNTSSTHIDTPNRLATCILPLQRNMPLAKKLNCSAGRKSENMKK